MKDKPKFIWKGYMIAFLVSALAGIIIIKLANELAIWWAINF